MGRSRSIHLLVVVTSGLLFALQALAPADSYAAGPAWTKTYSGAANGWDGGEDLVVAANGSVYVTGVTEVAGQDRNLLLRKYAPNGALVWMKTYNGVANGGDGGSGVAVTADGSVYVTGWTDVAGQGRNLLLRKYGPNGALVWMKTYNGAENGFDVGFGVAVAADGSVYVTGITEVAGQDRNLLLRKYSPKGALAWMKTYNGAENGTDVGMAVAVAADGSVYVTGYTEVAGQDDNLLLRKYTPTGALVWMKTYNGAANEWDEGIGVAVAADGSVYVTGGTFAARGNLLLRKYSPNGALAWMKIYNGVAKGGDGGKDVAVAADGSVYVTGYTEVAGQSGNLLLRKYAPNGALAWMKTYNGAANGSDGGEGVAVAADGSVYVTGNTYVEGQDGNLLLRKFK